MFIRSLKIENFRNLGSVEIQPHERLNWLRGANGAGKTSILESLVVLSRGKSFKTAHAEELIGEKAGAFRIFLEAEVGRSTHRLGLERGGKQWKARMDGQDVVLLSVLTRLMPMVLLEPNSHLLVSGPPDGRRRYLDWGVFHVEPAFLETWRRYSRILKQRNAALRERQVGVLDSVDDVLSRVGEDLAAFRQRHFNDLVESYGQQVPGWAEELHGIALSLFPGWREEKLLEALQRTRKGDLERGITSQGPHRADILLLRDTQAIRTRLSRGEQKALAAALLMSQARLLAACGERPLVLLDDLASEFDPRHVAFVLDNAVACAGQIFVTGTSAPQTSLEHSLFHVEHGNVQEMV